jgi:hypothetical protein
MLLGFFGKQIEIQLKNAIFHAPENPNSNNSHAALTSPWPSGNAPCWFYYPPKVRCIIGFNHDVDKEKVTTL